jgi:hypothetical protein
MLHHADEMLLLSYASAQNQELTQNAPSVKATTRDK